MGKPKRELNLAGELYCPKCQRWLEAKVHFYWDKANWRWAGLCKDCHRESTKVARLKRVQKVKEAEELRAQMAEEELRSAHTPLGPPESEETYWAKLEALGLHERQDP